jgi:4-amino-4-deoxy-L-arabinose transferase-like glycosyltransferase
MPLDFLDERVRRPPLARGLVTTIVLVTVATHLVVNATSPYGFHRDEFLYVAMGEHLDLFRMDFPPAIALLANASRAVLGDSVMALRALPALAHGLLVLLAAWFAAEAAGGRFAQALAAVTIAVSPLFLRAGTLFQPVIFDQVAWTLALAALARTANGRSGRWWLALGAALGIGLLVKFSIAFCAVGVAIAVLVARRDAVMGTPWPWLAAVLAVVIGSPSLVGQVALDWPVLGQLRDLRSVQLEHVSRGAFLTDQFRMLGPALFIALAGLWSALGDSRTRALRPVAIATLAAFLLLLAARGKAYYAGPIYPALIGIGATTVDRWAGDFARTGTAFAMRAAALVLVLLFGAVALPLGLPFLAPDAMARYAARVAPAAARTTNTGTVLELPQDYADMLGWPEMVATVDSVWRALPADERARATIVGDNYGRAGAIDLLGAPDLPAAISPAGSYWFWGPGPQRGDPTIVVGGDMSDLSRFFADVRRVAIVRNPRGVPEERIVPIFIGRAPRRALAEVWPELGGQN